MCICTLHSASPDNRESNVTPTMQVWGHSAFSKQKCTCGWPSAYTRCIYHDLGGFRCALHACAVSFSTGGLCGAISSHCMNKSGRRCAHAALVQSWDAHRCGFMFLVKTLCDLSFTFNVVAMLGKRVCVMLVPVSCDEAFMHASCP